MDKKEEKRRRILPPIEELAATPDLVNEALRKVIPPSPTPIVKTQEQSAPTPLEKAKPEEQKKDRAKPAKKLSTARSQYDSVTTELSHRDSVIIEPSHDITQSQYDPAIIYPSKNYLITPHFLLDEVLPTLNPYEQIILLRLFRLSYGFRRNTTDPVGKKTLADKGNMSVGMVKKVLRSLEKKRLIKTIPDKSNDPTKGNRYRVLEAFRDKLTGSQHDPATTEPSHNIAQSQYDPIKVNIDDDSIKNKNHHLSKVKELYESITGNTWSKNDDDSYSKIQEFDLQIIEQGIKIVSKRAKDHPNSFEYFVKQIQIFGDPSEEERKRLKKALGELVNVTRQARVGGDYETGLKEDVMRRCEWEGVFFDEDLYEEILDESRYGRWDPE